MIIHFLKLINAPKAPLRMYFTKSKRNLSQRGLSLIELMIVILLASFLILGITKVFSGNAISSKVAKDLGYATEGGGYGSLLLTKYLRLTGYVNYFQINEENSTVNKVVFDGESIDNGDVDVVVIEYEAPVRSHIDPNQKYITCGGIDVNGGTRVKETFRVNLNAQLECFSEADAREGTSILVAGVDGFQVQYGLAGRADEESVNRYVNATTAAALLQGPANQLLRSIRFAILVRSDEKETTTATSGDSFQLLDTPVSSKQTSVVNSSYRVYETTVAIFNAAKGRLP